MRLLTTIRSCDDTTPLKAVACFPWNDTSLSTLWHGEMKDERAEQWRQMLIKWSGAIAVGGGPVLRVFAVRGPNERYRPLFRINTASDGDICCIAWSLAVEADGFYPLVAFSGTGRILYVWDVERQKWHGILRGHGGTVNALSSHPVDPYYLVSASSDHTCRIYDLTERANGPVVNPRWLGSNAMALAGPAFGLRSTDSEGEEYGRCMAILVGGRSGGHRAPVRCVAFHPSFPLIATCGDDHAVKLWRIPCLSGDTIAREDKPLFSSTHVHRAPVHHIAWMDSDTLVSSSGPIIKHSVDDTSKLVCLPGTLVLWRWLSMDLFCSADRMASVRSDYQKSNSYMVIAEYELPSRTAVAVASHASSLLALPSADVLRLATITNFLPVRFPDSPTTTTTPSPPDPVPCRTEYTRPGMGLTACAFGEDGRLLVGVSGDHALWIWQCIT